MTARKNGREFDPFSIGALNAVEAVEALPHSHAFEHALYEHRLHRIAQHSPTDTTPITLDPYIFKSQFPDTLRDTFHELSYTVESLHVRQIDAPETYSLEVDFLANDIKHSFHCQGSVDNLDVTHTTTNASNEAVVYHPTYESVVGLLAALLYAQQYDPAHPEQDIILDETTLTAERDPFAILTEQIIMTLGNTAGHSSIETKALFHDDVRPPMIATLIEKEYPTKSGEDATLTLSEIDDTGDLMVSTETDLHQSLVNIEQTTGFIEAGTTLTHRYAEHRASVLGSPLTITETIDPSIHERWARTCVSFLGIVKKPMAAYRHLDSSDYLH